MVHQVIQKHFPVGEEARAVENGLALKAQLPVFRPGFVRRILQSGADLGCAFVKARTSCAADSKGKGFWLLFAEIQFRSGQNRESETCQFGHMRCEFAQRHRFGMRRKIFLVCRNALQSRRASFSFLHQIQTGKVR